MSSKKSRKAQASTPSWDALQVGGLPDIGRSNSFALGASFPSASTESARGTRRFEPDGTAAYPAVPPADTHDQRLARGADAAREAAADALSLTDSDLATELGVVPADLDAVRTAVAALTDAAATGRVSQFATDEGFDADPAVRRALPPGGVKDPLGETQDGVVGAIYETKDDSILLRPGAATHTVVHEASHRAVALASPGLTPIGAHFANPLDEYIAVRADYVIQTLDEFRTSKQRVAASEEPKERQAQLLLAIRSTLSRELADDAMFRRALLHGSVQKALTELSLMFAKLRTTSRALLTPEQVDVVRELFTERLRDRAHPSMDEVNGAIAGE